MRGFKEREESLKDYLNKANHFLLEAICAMLSF